MHKYLFKSLPSVFLDKHPGVELLDQRVNLHLIFLKMTVFHKSCIILHSVCSAQELQFFHILANTYYFLFCFIIAILCVCVKLPQSCPILCNPMDCSPLGSSVHGILQARILEWVAMPSSRGSFLTQGSNPGLLHCSQILYHMNHRRSKTVLQRTVRLGTVETS